MQDQNGGVKITSRFEIDIKQIFFEELYSFIQTDEGQSLQGAEAVDEVIDKVKACVLDRMGKLLDEQTSTSSIYRRITNLIS